MDLQDELDIVVAGFPVHDGETLLVLHDKLERWLPPGGHIEENETPDEAVRREIREELDMKVEPFPHNGLKRKGQVKANLARPFHVNVHDVGDHDHCCLFYACRPESTEANLKRDEVRDARWFFPSELEAERVPGDVEDLGKLALEESETSRQ
jgi:ADP-ribose pyrophosphatase YjhB (NUDIX family)